MKSFLAALAFIGSFALINSSAFAGELSCVKKLDATETLSVKKSGRDKVTLGHAFIQTNPHVPDVKRSESLSLSVNQETGRGFSTLTMTGAKGAFVFLSETEAGFSEAKMFLPYSPFMMDLFAEWSCSCNGTKTQQGVLHPLGAAECLGFK
jgi:hypothetical protein